LKNGDALHNGSRPHRALIVALALALAVAASGGPPAQAAAPEPPQRELIKVQLAVVVVQQVQLPQLRRIAGCAGPRKVACVRVAARRLASVSGQGAAALAQVRDSVRFPCARQGATVFIEGTRMYRAAALRLARHGQRLRAKPALLAAEEQQGRGIDRLDSCVPRG
jgi:hypothetical protein